MELEYLGHAAFALHHDDGVLLVDPYEHGQFGGRMAYRPIDVTPQWVVTSHDHVDHAAADAVPGTPVTVVRGAAGPFAIERHHLWHDEYEGRRRGGAVDALIISDDEGKVVHLSDVGHSPSAADVEALGGADVLLVPVGGYYTIGAAQAWEWTQRLNPRVVIPMHFATPACSLPIRAEDIWSSWARDVSIWNSHRFHVQEPVRGGVIIAPRLV